ncbi:MAG: ATP-grasp domain-containing protein [Pseudomonadota bacterium]
MRNVFVLGLDDTNEQELRSIRRREDCRFIRLLDHDAVRPRRGRCDFHALVRSAHAALARHDGAIDAIVGYLDFPSSALAGVLRNAYGLPGPSNDAIAKCEHKYWSRLEQRAAAPELVPRFCAVDPFRERAGHRIDLDFPFWIKPVKAHSSHLGFRISGPRDLERHIPEIRAKIGRFGRPFNQYLSYVPGAGGIAPVDGYWCIAEEIVSAGRQCTLEGYVHRGRVVSYGVVDSIRSGRHRSSFTRYQYPSTLPERVRARMAAAAETIMARIGYDDAPFNMEFYWHRRSDRLWVLEINARISKSHCPLFRLVDGTSHHAVMVDLALGERPEFPHRQGAFQVAAKFMIRVYHDGTITRVPGEAELARIETLYPEARVNLLVEEGARLAALPYQDSYSFELAELYLGARHERELLEKYAVCRKILEFDLVPAQPQAARRDGAEGAAAE